MREKMTKHKVQRAVFLAAGFGMRMRPVTKIVPKPLVEVDGVRIIDRLIDRCLEIGINEIYIVRGYIPEAFNILKQKYPMIHFIDSPDYANANNISSAYLARHYLQDAYVFESDLLLYNPNILCKYHNNSNFLGIWKTHSDDWCLETKNNRIINEKLGGDSCWQLVGISYWTKEDGKQLALDLEDIYIKNNMRNIYWEQVPLIHRNSNYNVYVRECFDKDVVEIDTYDELLKVNFNNF